MRFNCPFDPESLAVSKTLDASSLFIWPHWSILWEPFVGAIMAYSPFNAFSAYLTPRKVPHATNMSNVDEMMIDTDDLDRKMSETREGHLSGISAARLFFKDEQLPIIFQRAVDTSDLREEGDARLCAYLLFAEAGWIKQQSRSAENTSMKQDEIQSTLLFRELLNRQAHFCRVVLPPGEVF